MVTGISEDSVTAFYIFFLIKNYQRIRKSEPADAIFYFFRTPTIDKEPLFFCTPTIDKEPLFDCYNILQDIVKRRCRTVCVFVVSVFQINGVRRVVRINSYIIPAKHLNLIPAEFID